MESNFSEIPKTSPPPTAPYPSALNPFDATIEISSIIPTVSLIAPPNSPTAPNANISELINPNYSQLNELPPSYDSLTSPLHQVISVSNPTNHAIFMNERIPVRLVCQFCRNTVLTVTREIRSPPVRSKRSKCLRRFMIGVFLAIFFGFLFTIFLGGGFILIIIFVMPGVLLFVLILFLLIYCCCSCGEKNKVHTDIHHSCPVCKNKLGVSNGTQMLPMTRAANEGRAPGF